MPPLLELENVEARYGPIKALHGVSLKVDEGKVVAVLGANGAGKTTTLRAVSNTVKRSGDIRFAGKPLGRRAPESVAKLGIAQFGAAVLDIDVGLVDVAGLVVLVQADCPGLLRFPAHAQRRRVFSGAASGCTQGRKQS